MIGQRKSLDQFLLFYCSREKNRLVENGLYRNTRGSLGEAETGNCVGTRSANILSFKLRRNPRNPNETSRVLVFYIALVKSSTIGVRGITYTYQIGVRASHIDQGRYLRFPAHGLTNQRLCLKDYFILNTFVNTELKSSQK